MSTMTTLSSMVDNAITVPENGVINFKLLRAFLHSLIQHLQLDNAIVKYESKLEETESDNVFEVRKEKEVDWYTKDGSKDKIIEDYVSDSSRDAKSKSKLSSTAEDGDSLGRKRSSVPGFIPPEIVDTVAKLEERVKDIASKLEALGSTSGHGESTVRASQEATSESISGSLKLTSISNRLEACEESLQKLAPSVMELAKESCCNTKKFNDFVKKVSNAVPGLGADEFLMADDKSSENYNTGSEVKRKSFSSMQQSGIDNKVIEAFTEMHQSLTAMKEDMSDLCSQQQYISSLAETMPVETITEIQNQISELQTKVQKRESSLPEESFIFDPEKVTELEKKMKEHSARVDELCNNFAEQLDESQGHISDMEKDLAFVMEKVNVNSDVTDVTSLGDLNEKIMKLQEDVSYLTETTNKLSDGQEDKDTNMNTLLMQIEEIKVMKADKEALEDALTDKADALAVNRKVSHDQFDAAFEELNRTIEEAQEKLRQQEKGWLSALEEIQNEISSKIDRIEITPLKDMIENKMKNIQDRITAVTAKRREIEALGTKKKMIRNLNCISCDTKVVMRATLGGTGLPLAASLPPNRSMRPYLTYELDQVRRQNRSLPSKNMQHFVTAVAEQKQRDAVPKSDRKDSHLCNRYCGGSHTIVTSQQRVARVGHFPDSATVTDNGPDGPVGNKNYENEKRSPNPTPRSSVNEA
ncbi:myosin-6-like [Ischnura elegans]|uniref:myosin-6-like n=1 Tax=Ischnura elegans TaxID=197161 RepID=UPI001ED8A48A|nr:myosin-6-like [Ischnura elegans]XP_046393780.1 myosin-6-like [Ischnura elegans]XP_046393790.1 myosin-6-like [Ischnura elegans]